jgi:hypothetical protein
MMRSYSAVLLRSGIQGRNVEGAWLETPAIAGLMGRVSTSMNGTRIERCCTPLYTVRAFGQSSLYAFYAYLDQTIQCEYVPKLLDHAKHMIDTLTRHYAY